MLVVIFINGKLIIELEWPCINNVVIYEVVYVVYTFTDMEP